MLRFISAFRKRPLCILSNGQEFIFSGQQGNLFMFLISMAFQVQWLFSFFVLPALVLKLIIFYLSLQYAWDANEEYLFKAMVAFAMRRYSSKSTTQ